MRSKPAVVAALILVALFWSTSGTVSKLLLVSLSPYTIAFLRFAAASVIMLPLYFLQPHRPSPRTLLTVLMPWSVFSTGNVILFYLGIKHTTANASVVIYAAIPVITAAADYLLYGRSLSPRRIAGIVTGLIGVILVVITPVIDGSGMGSLYGNLIIGAGMLSWAVYSLASQRLFSRNGGVSAVSASAAGLWTSTLVTGIAMSILVPAPLAFRWTLPVAGMIAYLSVFVTVVTFILYQWCIKHSSATVASMTNYVQPVFAFLINGIVLRERIGPWFLAGSLLAVGGVVLAATGSSRTRGMAELVAQPPLERPAPRGQK